MFNLIPELFGFDKMSLIVIALSSVALAKEEVIGSH